MNALTHDPERIPQLVHKNPRLFKRREGRKISCGKMLQPAGTVTRVAEKPRKLSQYSRAEDAALPGSQYNIMFSSISSSLSTCRGSPPLPFSNASLRVRANLPTMETKQPVPRAILVGIQLDGVDDAAHEASLKELGRLVETLGYEVAGAVSQKRDGIGGLTVLGKGKLAELAAITGGTGVVGGWTA